MTLDNPDGENPKKPKQGGEVALFAVLGFLSYCGLGVVALATQQFWLWPVLVAGSVAIAIKVKWRGFVLGFGIGVGLTLLAVGLCFATFKMGG